MAGVESLLAVLLGLIGMLFLWLFVEQVIELFSRSPSNAHLRLRVLDICGMIKVLVLGALTVFTFSTWYIMRFLLCLPRRFGRSLGRERRPAAISASDGGGLHPIHMLAEIPLALLSYAHYWTSCKGHQSLKAWCRGPTEGGTNKNSKIGWHSYVDAELCSGTGPSRAWMYATSFKGPRWNTHCHQFVTDCKISSEGHSKLVIEGARDRDVLWRAVFKNWRGDVVAEAAPYMSASGAVTIDIDGEANTQLLVLIFVYMHEGCCAASVPCLKCVDGDVVAESILCSRKTLSLYGNLRKQEDIILLAHHWYLFPLVSARRWLPRRFVDQQMLPDSSARSLATGILYGVVLEGYDLAIAVDPKVSEMHLVLCTMYNRASLPIACDKEVRGVSTIVPDVREDGLWLVRIIPLDGSSVDPVATKGVQVELVRSDHACAGTRQQPTS